MRADIFRPPTDAEIAEAEAKLAFSFPSAYRTFLKGGGDVANAKFEAAVVLPDSGHLDIFDIATTAWNTMGVPRSVLPIVEDNGDYFCLTPQGGVTHWSHNGATDETWPTFDAWFEQVCVERR
jgi:hypothetical protein